MIRMNGRTPASQSRDLPILLEQQSDLIKRVANRFDRSKRRWAKGQAQPEKVIVPLEFHHRCTWLNDAWFVTLLNDVSLPHRYELLGVTFTRKEVWVLNFVRLT